METASPKSAKRVRRSAEEARKLILDAAERRLAKQGPEGIRLQDIARDCGISHPAILHHFESREGLVRALIARTSGQLRETLLGTLEIADVEEERPDADQLITKVFEALSDRGTARLLSWMLLTGREIETQSSQTLISEIAAELHRRRLDGAKRRGEPSPGAEDTMFMAMLTTSAAFGDAIIGPYLAAAAGLDAEGMHRFRHWLAQLLSAHAQSSGSNKIK